MSASIRLQSLWLAASLALTACGGGGGGGDDEPGAPPPPAPPQGWTISGRVALPETASVDSDTNDVEQAGRTANNSLATAQPLTAPTLAVGTVNVAGGGPEGPNRSTGDEDDMYRVALKAGQTLELEFASDPADNDVDLYVHDPATGDVLGQSIGTNQYECVRVLQDGDYVVDVNAYSGAAIYNLRISAPADGGDCEQTAGSTGSAIIPGQLVAKPLPGAPARAQALQLAQASGLVLLQGDAATERPLLLGVSAEGRARAAAAPPASGRAVRDTVHRLKRLRASGQYAYVEPNLRLRLAATPVGSFPPDDRAYPLQRWHYEMIGLPSAMDRLVALSPQPAQRPLVAVIDSGIVKDHPDLAEQIVDGYSFVAAAGGTNTADPDDPATPDSNGAFHGSHVAGTIGAVTFNGIGGAGVAPMAQLLPLRTFRPDGNAALYDVLQAIFYAARLPNDAGRLPPRRADVINMSLGAQGACSAAFRDGVAQARAEGVIVVAAAGNEARNDQGRSAPVGMPANCPGVIAVGALDAGRSQAFYSNAGATLALAAPGGDVRRSTTGTGEPDGVYSTVATFDTNGARVPSYGQMMGTSMASPHVAGVMALMRFVHPGLSPADVDTLIAAGRLSDDLGAAGRDDATGYGAVNARKAVDAALELRDGTPPPAPAGEVRAAPSSIHFGSTRTGADLTLALSAAGDETVQGVTSDHPAVTVSEVQVEAATGLGTYRVGVNRAALPAGTSYAAITVQTSARSFTVPVSVTKAGAGSATADFGRLYVLLLDAASGEVLGQQAVHAASGRYDWQLTGVTATRLHLVAGTDLDNDGVICQRGEACGAYPVLATPLQDIELDGSRSGLDFPVAPFGGANAQGVEAAAAGWRRLR